MRGSDLQKHTHTHHSLAVSKCAVQRETFWMFSHCGGGQMEYKKFPVLPRLAFPIFVSFSADFAGRVAGHHMQSCLD